VNRVKDFFGRAFFALVLNNAQSELSPLEIGMHALMYVGDGQGKKGAGVQAYAMQIGKDRANVSRYRDAAEVYQAIASCIDTRSLLDKAQHLAAIHGAPESAWPVLVEAMLTREWSVKDTQES